MMGINHNNHMVVEVCFWHLHNTIMFVRASPNPHDRAYQTFIPEFAITPELRGLFPDTRLQCMHGSTSDKSDLTVLGELELSATGDQWGIIWEAYTYDPPAKWNLTSIEQVYLLLDLVQI